MNKRLKTILLFLKDKKSYFYPGLIIFTLLFLLGNYINLSSTYMGNEIDAVIDIVVNHYLLAIIILIIKILLVYLVFGLIFSIVFYRAILELKKRSSLIKDNYSPFRLTIGTLSFFVFLIFSNKIIVNPQLYTESFDQNATILKGYQIFLTDYISPYFFDVIIYLMIAGAVTLFVISFDWSNIISNLKQRAGSIRYKNAIIILILLSGITCILYDQNIIFSGKKSSRPNIIILSADALRPDNFSCNGYHRKTTPNIDRIAKESLQVRGVITPVPRTFPSWVSILTSQYPLTHEIKHMFPRTRERNVEFNSAGKYLGKLGYNTAVISDFGGDIFPRLDFGFKETITPEFNFGNMMKQIVLEKQTFLLPFITNRIGMMIFPEMRGLAKYSIPETLTDEIISEIESSRGEPFFIVAFHSITHFPYAAPYPYYQKYAIPEYSGDYKYLKQTILKIGDGDSSKQKISREDKEQITALYDGCLNLFDKEVGEIYDYLHENNLLKNTLVIITADHGENMFEPNLGIGHGEHLRSNYPLEVPLIISSENLKRLRGKRAYKLSSTIDIMPTVFDLAGIDLPAFFDGTSIIKKLRHNTNRKNINGNGIDAYTETGMWFDNNKSSDLFFHHMRIDYPEIIGVSEVDFTYRDEIVIQQRYQNIVNASKHRAIYSGRYKLIYIPLPSGVKFELYNYIKDPDNKRDLSKTHREMLAVMKRKFYRFIDEKSSGNFIVRKGFLFPAFSDPIF